MAEALAAEPSCCPLGFFNVSGAVASSSGFLWICFIDPYKTGEVVDRA